MAAVAVNGDRPVEPAPPKNLLLRIIDGLAEWLMREELRIISRSNRPQINGGERRQPR
jgi:hypothetical protein